MSLSVLTRMRQTASNIVQLPANKAQRPSPDQLITVREAATRLAITEKTLRRYISEGRLTGYRVGPRLIRVDVQEVTALLAPIPTWGS